MIRITFKDSSVKAHKIRPDLFMALATAADVWEEFGADALIITSLNDGAHRQGSYHYSGDAADLRTKNLPSSAAKRNVRDVLAQRLGNDWDVILEDLGGSNEHAHLEWDPKP